MEKCIFWNIIFAFQERFATKWTFSSFLCERLKYPWRAVPQCVHLWIEWAGLVQLIKAHQATAASHVGTLVRIPASHQATCYCVWEGRAQVLGSLTQVEFQLLTSAWTSPGCCRPIQLKDLPLSISVCRSLLVFLVNK